MQYIPKEQIAYFKLKFSERYSIRPSGCWIWTRSFDSSGYGWFWLATYNKKDRAHRVSWMLEGNTIPKGHGVFHHCDEEACVNPAHLFCGPQKDNLVDMAKKERHGRSKLTIDAVINIRASNLSDHELAKIYKVDHATIGHVRARRTWQHAP